MIVSSIGEFYSQQPEWKQQWEQFQQAQSLPPLVCAVLQLGLLFARLVLEAELNQRTQAPQIWPVCGECGRRLRSKGFRVRQMMTLIGAIR